WQGRIVQKLDKIHFLSTLCARVKKDRSRLLPEKIDDIKNELALLRAHRRQLAQPVDPLTKPELAHVAHAADLQAVHHPEDEIDESAPLLIASIEQHTLNVILHLVALLAQALSKDEIITAHAPAKRIVLAEPAFPRLDDHRSFPMFQQSA